MESVLASLETAALAQYLRGARWAYAAVNGAHILGIALLVGAIVPLDLKLLGFWPRVDRRDLARVLVPVSMAGLVLAACMGFLLFATRATEYADVTFFRIKLLFVFTGVSAAILLHLRHGYLLQDACARTLRAHALLSLVCWTGALACGRLIAFAGQ